MEQDNAVNVVSSESVVSEVCILANWAFFCDLCTKFGTYTICFSFCMLQAVFCHEQCSRRDNPPFVKTISSTHLFGIHFACLHLVEIGKYLFFERMENSH